MKKKKILDLPQDLVKSIVGKILERAEGVRKSLTAETDVAVKSIKKTSKKVVAKAKSKVKRSRKKEK